MSKGLTLSVCESCTGGLLAAALTSVPGSSGYFAGGIIAYADRVKADVVGVRPATLRRFGAVSAQAAREMARGVRKAARTDIAVAITGIAGPSGGSARKPVGLVYIAVAAKAGAVARRFLFKGSRTAVRSAAVREALILLKRTVSGQARR